MIPSFFGGDTGITYEQLQRKKQIAESLMNQQRPSRNVGEGIGSFAKQISGALIQRRADKRDAELKAQADQMFGSIFGGGSVPGMPAVSSAPSYATPERNAAMAATGGPTQAAADAMAGDFPASLIETESGGNWSALNDVEGAGGIKGHGGRLQFGGARLQDAARAGVIPAMSPQEFAQQPPEVQQRVENWHFSDIDRQASEMGLDRYIGKTVNGIPINQNAIRGMAHLGGIGGAAKFLQSGGQHDPSDAYGTSLSDYARRHGQGQRGQSVQVADAGGMGNMGAIVSALSNPYIRQDPGKVAILQQLLSNRMAANDPAAQLDLAYKRAQLEQMQNPQSTRTLSPEEVVGMGFPEGSVVQQSPDGSLSVVRQPQAPDMPSSVEEYEYARQNGFEGSYQDWVTQKAQAGASSVSTTLNTGDPVDSRPMADKPPKGYQRRWNPELESWVDEPIPGGEDAREIEAAEEKTDERQRQQAIKMGTTLENIDLNIKEIEDGGFPVTGFWGSLSSNVPGSAAKDFSNRNTQITTRAALDEVQNMRDNSPTGGAVGQLTDSEREAIGLAATTLMQSSSAEEYLRNAKKYRETMLDTAYGEGNWTIGEGGEVLVGATDAPPGEGTNRFAEMPRMELLEIDINDLSSEELEAYERALMGGN